MINSLPAPPPPFHDSRPWAPRLSSLPTCPVSLPSLGRWRCSIATLCNVRKLRKSTSKGILFEYDNHSNAVGDFRPSEAQEWIVAPRWFRISTEDQFNHNIDFFVGELDSPAEFRRMEGHLVMWFSGRKSFFQIQD